MLNVHYTFITNIPANMRSRCNKVNKKCVRNLSQTLLKVAYLMSMHATLLNILHEGTLLCMLRPGYTFYMLYLGYTN